MEFNHIANVFHRFLDSVSLIEPAIATELRKEWDIIYNFFRFEYYHSHLASSSKCVFHCAYYGLSESNCTHSHDFTKVCSLCYNAFTFFKLTVPQKLKGDILNIYRSLPLLHKHLVRYAAHRCREKHQAEAIKEIMQSLEDLNLAIIVIDHKQKTLPMKFMEGQGDYFGKNGMSILGIMVVLHDGDKLQTVS
jgi:hypothetical protein